MHAAEWRWRPSTSGNLASATTQMLPVRQLKPMQAFAGLDFHAGARYCMHVPTLRDGVALASTLADSVDFELAIAPIHVATMPERDSWIRRAFRPTSPVRWLAKRAHWTVQLAAQEISALPIPVPDQFRCMAMNPRQFLAFLGASAGEPKTLIYQTDGMDPLGLSSLHSFACDHFTTGTLIHCTSQPIRSCPLAPRCVSIEW